MRIMYRDYTRVVLEDGRRREEEKIAKNKTDKQFNTIQHWQIHRQLAYIPVYYSIGTLHVASSTTFHYTIRWIAKLEAHTFMGWGSIQLH